LKIKTLTDMTHWSHVALAEVLRPGDLAVDLTVGSGNDTAFLAEAVGPGGCVAGFDIQVKALEGAAAMLAGKGIEVTLHKERGEPGIPSSGVHLYLADHARWTDLVDGAPKAIIANLGYLPGYDQSLVTEAATTVAALSDALERLPVGGRLAVVCYQDHPGGREEGRAVKELLTRETHGAFRVLCIDNHLYLKGPFVMVAERRKKLT